VYKENTINFKSEKEHMKWMSNNRITGIKEIGCCVKDDFIEVKYIKLY